MGGDTTQALSLLTVRAVDASEFAVAGAERHVLVKLETDEDPALKTTRRAPVALALVLDRSGSMSGKKLAEAKATLKRVVENLRTDDTVHVVAFGSEVEAVVANGNTADKETILKRIDAIVTEGMTNMAGGLQAGRDLLVEHARPGLSAKRVFLFSDGQANQGKTSSLAGLTGMARDFLAADRVSTTTFGVGDDFNEELMQQLAEVGGGNYFFLDEPANYDRFVGAALNGLLGRIAADAVLRFAPLGGARVVKIYNSSSLTEMAIGDLKQANVKSVLVKVLMPDPFPAAPGGGAVPFLSWSLTATSVLTADAAAPAVAVAGTVATRPALTPAERTRAAALADEVAVAVAVQLSADAEEEIQRLLEQNRVADAVARKASDIAQLEGVSAQDASGKIGVLVQRSRERSAQLAAHGASKANVKSAKHTAYLQRHDSSDYLMA